MPRRATGPSPRWLPWTRSALGVAVLVTLLGQLGVGPFVTALREISGWGLLAALVVTVGTTACCAWRWSVVATGLGAGIHLRAAVAAYYRSQLLNATLPGGVLGDVHRAICHGRAAQQVGRGVRSVVWERSLGQGVQLALTVVVLLLLRAPVHVPAVMALVGLVAFAIVVALVRIVGLLADDLRLILRAPGAAVGIALASCLAVAGHVVVFLVAIASAGVEAPVAQQVVLALIVLLGATIPANIAGWGMREGVAAWAFQTAGFGAGAGITVAVVYGLLSLASVLPGVFLLVTRTPGASPVERSRPGRTCGSARCAATGSIVGAR